MESPIGLIAMRPATEAQVATSHELPASAVSNGPVAGEAARERPTSPGENGARTAATEYTKRAIYLVLTIVEVAVALRFALRLLAANPVADFSRALYALTTPLVLPFRGVFPDAARRGSVVELSTLLALAIYAIVAWIIVRMLLLVRER